MCDFCNFDKEAKEYEIGLYECTSYKYKGIKYFLEVEMPLNVDLSIGNLNKIKPVEVFYCPKCGQKLKWDDYDD